MRAGSLFANHHDEDWHAAASRSIDASLRSTTRHRMHMTGITKALRGLSCVAFLSTGVVFAASPLSPEAERATFRLADDTLTIELVAAEPQVRAPVAIAWDADGRMFVAEMTDYPSGPVSGRIRMLEAPDAAGRYQRSTVFATNLAYPNGVMPWRNGLLVTAAPDIWFLADTNGDGAADLRERILTGFAEGNQQLRVNGLYWGIDNWIYGANGRSDGEVTWPDGAKAGSIRRKDFRFRPGSREFEPMAGNSQFGMGRDDWGNRFPVFNATPIRHVVMEDSFLARQPALASVDIVPDVSPADGNRVFALTSPNVLIPQPIGFFTSACGPSVFRGTALPPDYAGNYFVCEPVQNIVQRRALRPVGSTFTAEYAHTNKEFLASSDPWFHGVFTATGPDGALYIVDFYRDLVEHPQWVAPELRDKVEWRKGEEHGRIWRVRARGTAPSAPGKLSSLPPAEWVKALESDNGWVRETAQRLLVEREDRAVVPALERLTRTARKPQTRIHALHTLDALAGNETNAHPASTAGGAEAIGGWNAVLFAALGDPSGRVREHAVKLAARFVGTNGTQQSKWFPALLGLANDSDARVRLQLAGVFARIPGDATRGDALARLARPEPLDEWQATAILGADARPWSIVRRVVANPGELGVGQVAFVERAAALIGSGTNQQDKQELLAWVADWAAGDRFLVAASLVRGLRPGERLESIKAKEGIARKLRADALTAARDVKAPLKIRIAAVSLIAPADAAALVVGGEEGTLASAAARVALEAGDAETVRRVFESFERLTRNVRRQVVAASVRSRMAALELVQAASVGKVALVEVDPATRQALEKSSDPEVQSRARALFKGAVSADREAVVQKFRAALQLTGNRKNGAEIFERTCAVCHQMQGVGSKVGPDLSGTGQQPRETLLVQILDPSRQVLPDFVAYNATTRKGDTYTGFIANETPRTLTLRRANEPDVTLERAELQDVTTSGRSLMPDGLEAGWSLQDMADLIEFLRRPDRTLFTQTK
jgi:putative membrane-bound dehydrogenase-like protein